MGNPDWRGRGPQDGLQLIGTLLLTPFTLPYRLFSPPLLGGIPEHEDHTDDLTICSPDRCGTVLDGPLGAIPGDQRRVVRQTDDDAFTNDPADRAFDRLAGLLAGPVRLTSKSSLGPVDGAVAGFEVGSPGRREASRASC